MADTQGQTTEDGGIKETLISLIIALAMALIVKCYVVEAYRIPTGSMAPTLLGDHAAYRGPQTGNTWVVDRGREGSSEDARALNDPVTGYTHPHATRANLLQAGAAPPGERPSQAGDRILVQKYLYEVSGPERFDICVFRNPTTAGENYIKRLVGLPNEHIWLVDGDVFASPFLNAPNPADAGLAQQTWQCQRKSVRTQRSLWRTIFSSAYTPLDAKTVGGSTWFRSPWTPQSGGWQIDGRRSYRYEGSGETALVWDTVAWPITDWEPYNDRMQQPTVTAYAMADVRMRAGVEPDDKDALVEATIRARQHEFQMSLAGTQATLRMRAIHFAGEPAPWTVLETASFKGLPAGRATPIEFWHADQALHVFVNGKRILHATYDWDPKQRLEFVTGEEFDRLRYRSSGVIERQVLARAGTYVHSGAEVAWRFSGSALTLHDVSLDRDIFYQPTLSSSRVGVGFGCHPDRVVTLGPDHFFMLGDNSGDSLDGRGWEDLTRGTPHGRPVDPWVTQQIDPTPGVVHRKLLLGKAFFVYFPAPKYAELFGFQLPIPIPDFGQMRLID